MNKRIKWIDTYRGLAIVLVVLEHVGLKFFGRFILAFHMPCFFVLSGYLYIKVNQNKYTTFRFIRNYIHRIGIPYCIYLMFYWIITYVCFPLYENTFEFITFGKKILQDVIYLDQYWFISCLFITGIIFHIIHRIILKKGYFINKKFIMYIIIIFLTLILSIIFNGKTLPFVLGQCFMALTFMSFGAIMAKSDKILDECSTKKLIILVFSCAIILSLTVSYNYLSNNKYGDNFYMYINTYGNVFVSVLGAIAGTLGLWIVNKVIQKPIEKYILLEKVLCWFGQNSLLIYPAHLWGIDISRWVRKIFIKNPVNWGIHFAINLLFAMIFLIICVHIVNRYCPEIGGKKRK